ncbi:DUF6232 family protein [Planosporangium sp. 12N6]|uniref:DUF6232 family protein n=1 Tax=Planosporangium spinosum TaxID=3402278 RepID=UPI003CF6BC54
MTIYYRGPEVVITDQVFTVLVPGPQSFPIDELEDVHVVAGYRRWPAPRSHELRATYRGYEILLFRSSDMRTFGQVKRGLMRVLEGRRERPEQYGGLGYR